jgi:phage terminase large subunit GpA-like protein
LAIVQENFENLLQQIQNEYTPQPIPPSSEWIQSNFYLPSESGEITGLYSLDYVPHMHGILDALDDPDIAEIALQKAAQVGWTYGLIAWLSKQISLAPCAIIVMFAKEGAAKEFNDEKFVPSVQATPALSALIDVSKSRASGNSTLFKKFVGGFLKLVGSRSISAVKSTPARIVIVEEPDDATEDLKKQGDSIKLLWERTKRLKNAKRILGGTPSIAGLSKVEDHIRLSDRRVLPIRCHDCGEKHVLDWDNVSWHDRDDGKTHEVYGTALPDTAVYVCPVDGCGSVWDDYQRRKNIRDTVNQAIAAGDPLKGWVPQGEFHGVAGFMELSELYSCLPGAGLRDLVQDYLDAEYEAAKGDETKRIVFQNSKLARAYQYRSDNATADQLREKALDYPENFSPAGGLLLTVGIDVQQNPARLAIVKRVWGRNEESWGVLWTEIHARHDIVDITDPVWTDAETIVFGPTQHASGASLYASAVSIDSSDGTTNAAVYDWVRKMRKKYSHVLVMAIKGSSSQQDPEIFATPRAKSIDHRDPRKQSKADRFGLKVYQVGTNKAKDWLAAHMKLEGEGPGRHHIYQDVRADYFDQVTGEVKAPHRTIRSKKVWQPRSGAAVEAWDCEVYALHAARARRVHLLQPNEWDALEAKVKQSDLFTETVEKSVEEQAAGAQPTKKSNSMADLARKLAG